MLIQVNTGNGVANNEALQRFASEHLTETLDRFQQDITRIEVQLTDESRARNGEADKRCMLEARLANHEPLAVNHHGETQDEAFRGAARKLLHALDHTLGKLRDHHRDRDSIRRDPAIAGVVPDAAG